jgi:hypothetical protein
MVSAELLWRVLDPGIEIIAVQFHYGAAGASQGDGSVKGIGSAEDGWSNTGRLERLFEKSVKVRRQENGNVAS